MGCLDGKVAVVTGSGQGVGQGIAEYFAAEGAAVVTNNRHPLVPEERPADEPEEEFERYRALRGDAEATASAIRAKGGQAVACFGDVADPEDAKRLVDCAIHEFGRIDILVNNAADLGQGTIEETCEESWQRQTRAKLDGAFHTMHYAVPYMKRQGGGCILNCSSNAWLGFSGLVAYSAANAGVVGLTWAASKELFDFGITVNAYCPQADSPGHVREFGRTVRQLADVTGEAPDPEVIAHAERMHGTAYDMAPFLAWLALLPDSYTSFRSIDAKLHAIAQKYGGMTVRQMREAFGIGPTTSKQVAEQVIVKAFGSNAKKMGKIALFAAAGIHPKSVTLTINGTRTEDMKLFSIDFSEIRDKSLEFEDSSFFSYFSESQMICMVFEEQSAKAPLDDNIFRGFKRLTFSDEFIYGEVRSTWTEIRSLVNDGRLRFVAEIDKRTGKPRINPKTGTIKGAPNFPKSKNHVVFVRGSGSGSTKKTLNVNGIQMYNEELWIKGTYIASQLESIQYI